MRPENNRSVIGFSGDGQRVAVRTKLSNAFVPQNPNNWNRIVNILKIHRCLAGEATPEEKKEIENWLKESAQNRKTFEEYKRIYAVRPKKKYQYDLDAALARFREINDTVGHHIGDKVLEEVSRRLTGALDSTAVLGRLSGDEFARIHRTAVLDRRMFRSMPLIDGAAEALWRLSDAGVWIRVITARLLFNGIHEASAADTAYWLDANNIPYRDLCFINTKPDVGADLYVTKPFATRELVDQVARLLDED
jgi:hypothetical protein